MKNWPIEYTSSIAVHLWPMWLSSMAAHFEKLFCQWDFGSPDCDCPICMILSSHLENGPQFETWGTHDLHSIGVDKLMMLRHSLQSSQLINRRYSNATKPLMYSKVNVQTNILKGNKGTLLQPFVLFTGLPMACDVRSWHLVNAKHGRHTQFYMHYLPSEAKLYWLRFP